MDFDGAWYVALQRLRIQPNMSADDIEELMAAKAWMDWAKPVWEAAYRGDPAPALTDGEIFANSDRADLSGLRADLSDPDS